MVQRRNKYSKEFKEQAIQLVELKEKSVTAIANDLGINPNMLWRWYREKQEVGTRSFPGNGNRQEGTDVEEENRRLKKELHLVTMERDILKKAVAIFSQPQK